MLSSVILDKVTICNWYTNIMWAKQQLIKFKGEFSFCVCWFIISQPSVFSYVPAEVVKCNKSDHSKLNFYLSPLYRLIHNAKSFPYFS